MKRISFNEHDAFLILEWRLAMLQHHPNEKDCNSCEHLRERLEKFLHEKEVKYLYKQMKKYPYAK